jgi:hypothetical protein
VLGLATLLKAQADPTAWPRDYLYDWADHFEWKLCGRPLAGDSAVGDPPGAHHSLEKITRPALLFITSLLISVRVSFAESTLRSSRSACVCAMLADSPTCTIVLAV